MRGSHPLLCLVAALVAWAAPSLADDPGITPTDANGVPLNLDFETGTLRGLERRGRRLRRAAGRGGHRLDAPGGHEEPARGEVLGRQL